MLLLCIQPINGLATFFSSLPFLACSIRAFGPAGVALGLLAFEECYFFKEALFDYPT